MSKPIIDDIMIKTPPTILFFIKMPMSADTPINPKTYLVKTHKGHAIKYKNLSIASAIKIIKTAEIATANSK